MASRPTRAEIDAARWTKAQLAEWGVPWPPPKGWRRRLLAVAEPVDARSRRGPRSGVRTCPYAAGERHRCWPEWTWDGSAFVRTAAREQARDGGGEAAAP